METKRALVYYDDKRAGVLKKTAFGYIFEYDKEYMETPGAKPISLSMPINQKRFESKNLLPFFDGLLPEGWLLDITSKTLKIDKENKFELLTRIGRDTIGAVSIVLDEDNKQ